jgi:hypothetical protein
VRFVTLSCAVVSFAPSHASAQSPNPASIAPGSSGAGLAPATPAAPSPQPPERSPRSGTRRQYCTSAVGRDAGSFNDAGNVINIGIGFEITVEEMIEYLHRAIMNSVRPVVAAVASLY